jgi:hypothetical protein
MISGADGFRRHRRVLWDPSKPFILVSWSLSRVLVQCLNAYSTIDRLNARVALLLNEDRRKFPLLTADQCHAIIKTFERMQDARDEELYNLIKPLIDHLRATVASIDMWKSIMELPRSELLKAFSMLVQTDMGMKPRSFELEGLVVVAIETSNKIMRALEIEDKEVGLSKALTLLKHNIKMMMANVEELLTELMKAVQPSPSAGAVYFDPLKVGLRKGIPSYLDPDEKVIKTASSKHPLVKTAGSEWNKWLKRHNTKFIRVDLRDNVFYMKVYVPEGPILELREAFKTATEVERAVRVERLQIAQNGSHQVPHSIPCKSRSFYMPS